MTIPLLKHWQWLTSGAASATEQMEADRALLGEFSRGRSVPLLRWYSWRGRCATYGRSQNIDAVRRLVGDQIEIAERPTAGGICFHEADDRALSFFIPRRGADVDDIRRVRQMLCQAVQELVKGASRLNGSNRNSPWCAERFVPGELSREGEKILAVSVRLDRSAFLIQANVRSFQGEKEVRLRQRLLELSSAH